MQKVIDLENIKIHSINKKYVIGKNGRLTPSRAYRDFKNILEWACHGKLMPKPYRVDIYLNMYLDIDNPLKAILDSLGKIIEDDRFIEELHVYKTTSKRGTKGRIQVYVDTIKQEKKK